MNLFWRSWNKLHVIFYILALRQVLINLCEKTQYLHNREFFFQKGKLFKNYLFLNFSWNCCIVFCLLKDWNTLLCTSLIQPLKKRFFPKTCVTKTKYSTYMKKYHITMRQKHFWTRIQYDFARYYFFMLTSYYVKENYIYALSFNRSKILDWFKTFWILLKGQKSVLKSIFLDLSKQTYIRTRHNSWSHCKLQFFWKGHKNLKKFPTCFDASEKKQLFCQNRWEIFSNFLAFS